MKRIQTTHFKSNTISLKCELDENTLLIIMIMMMMMMVIVIKMISKNNVNNHSCHLKGQVSLSLQSTVLCKRASVFFKNILFFHIYSSTYNVKCYWLTEKLPLIDYLFPQRHTCTEVNLLSLCLGLEGAPWVCEV